ncbi:hypothetical protein ACEYXF_41005 [Streptomyces asiaticus]|uniref:hypothetical protein n=1 Tax=Streptomyces asiaticus TaxID=114695 RepID=UPI0039BE2707
MALTSSSSSCSAAPAEVDTSASAIRATVRRALFRRRPWPPCPRSSRVRPTALVSSSSARTAAPPRAAPPDPSAVGPLPDGESLPVLAQVDFGHTSPNLPLPIGVRAHVDADNPTLSLLEPAVAES